MRSSRASTAWAGIALSTSLIGLAVAGVQTQPSAPTSVLSNTSVHVVTSDRALDGLEPDATRDVRSGADVSGGGKLTGGSDQTTAVAPR